MERNRQLFLMLGFLILFTQAKSQNPFYDITDFGAIPSDNKLDTEAINSVIKEVASKGGGTIYFPPGNYLSSSIHLESNITLYLEAGSVLEAVHDSIAKYDFPEPNPEGGNYQDYGHSHWKNSLIWGIGLENVSIIGPGLIYGKGLVSEFYRFADISKGEKTHRDSGPGAGNKAIALKNCHNVILRDFSVLHGGHFAILATGVDNMTIDNLKIDTNRDGINIDVCQNVRVTNCSVNSPWDDAIVLKASYALGKIRHCENITISDCYLAGNFDEGTLLDGTFKRSKPEYLSYTTGRIKMGTESNGDFKNITITNCVFDESRGIAIESVDGGHIEDVAISNITMRNASNSPIFIRLGNRARGPENPPVGSIKRITIENIVVYNAHNAFATSITGLPGHPIEDIRISNVRFNHAGGGKIEDSDIIPKENDKGYPEPGMFGPLPAYSIFIRHAKDIDMNHVKIDYNTDEERPPFVLSDVSNIYLNDINAKTGKKNNTVFDLRNVSGFHVKDSRNVADQTLEDNIQKKKVVVLER